MFPIGSPHIVLFHSDIYTYIFPSNVSQTGGTATCIELTNQSLSLCICLSLPLSHTHSYTLTHTVCVCVCLLPHYTEVFSVFPE